MKAYVLINIRNGEGLAVVRQLRRIEGVGEANFTFGPYDAVAVVDAPDIKKVGSIVHDEIQPIPGVLDTLTCLSVDD
ncbi:MAG: Lrp/AsnC ligand binding domain-containing protein [Anaerolineae bacterium]|jgi:DNA-binding Lrp family transcriptional regulator|nr:Lrp/AsnC ligand binding domain-containing protein [Anaerolineae bacterium]MBT7072216.1 Lrp/AsnC ligand binding domain-containing protein [Anaerolineae bacterium]MBT7323964.1 Lrp/AsnC ligand binding domain-containing protein [Anaerolineae bacterium]